MRTLDGRAPSIAFTYPARLGSALQSRRQRPGCKFGLVSVKHRCELGEHRFRARVNFRSNVRYQRANKATANGIDSRPNIHKP